MLIAVIKGPTLAQALREMQKALALVDGFELRLDQFEESTLEGLQELIPGVIEKLGIGQGGALNLDQVLPVLKQLNLNKFSDAGGSQIQWLSDAAENQLFNHERYIPSRLIFTFRKRSQGGASLCSEEQRLQWIERLLELQPDYCDLESDTDPVFIEKIAKKFPEVKLIGSTHDFEKTPEDLETLFVSMQNPHFSSYKIAVKANSSLDLFRLLAFAKEKSADVPLSCISLGKVGQPSRILGPLIGNLFDYAVLEEEREPLFRYALKTLHDLYRYKALNRESELFALLGDPIDRSQSHLFHNRCFAKEGRNAVYVKIQTRKEELASLFPYLRQLNICGLSVTMPLKEAIIPLLDDLDPTAASIGAVNTVTVKNGLFVGSNTDAAGALNAIEEKISVQGKRLAILGAGGTARAIAFEALQRGATVALFNRTLARAEKVAALFGCEAYPLNRLDSYSYDLLVSTLPPTAQLSVVPRAAVMDIVYASSDQALLKKARKCGYLILSGRAMWLEQARLQQRAWSY